MVSHHNGSTMIFGLTKRCRTSKRPALFLPLPALLFSFENASTIYFHLLRDFLLHHGLTPFTTTINYASRFLRATAIALATFSIRNVRLNRTDQRHPTIGHCFEIDTAMVPGNHHIAYVVYNIFTRTSTMRCTLLLETRFLYVGTVNGLLVNDVQLE